MNFIVGDIIDIQNGEFAGHSLPDGCLLELRWHSDINRVGWVKLSCISPSKASALALIVVADRFGKRLSWHSFSSYKHEMVSTVIFWSFDLESIYIYSDDKVSLRQVLTVGYQRLGRLQTICHLLNETFGRGQWISNLKFLIWSVRNMGFRATLASYPTKIKGNLSQEKYEMWIEHFDTYSQRHRDLMISCLTNMRSPLISIIMPVYNCPRDLLVAAIESVRKQLYGNWELCIADDKSTCPHVKEILTFYQKLDARIKIVFRSERGHIAAASNSALNLGSGDFVVLMDQDDLLSEYALFFVAKEIERYPEVKFIYSDEDKLDQFGRRVDPFFKPDWSPDLFNACNYLNHLTVLMRQRLIAVGKWHEGFDGAQDYDLYHRFLYDLPSSQIRHIPRILYHWRMAEGSASTSSANKSYAYLRSRQALERSLGGQRLNVQIIDSEIHGWHRVRYQLPSPPPFVSIVIPVTSSFLELHRTITDLLDKTCYEQFEIIVVVGNCQVLRSGEQRGVLHDLSDRIHILAADQPMTWPKQCNFGVGAATGEILVFYSCGLRIRNGDWLSELVQFALLPGVGAVGPKICDLNNTIQTAGVVIGMTGIFGHIHRGLAANDNGYCGRLKVPQNFTAVTGACMVTKRWVFDKVNRFEEQSTLFSDLDLCLKIREHGYRVVWTPYSELDNIESQHKLDLDDERVRQDCNWIIGKWNLKHFDDPYYNPNLSLLTEIPGIAMPPRVIN